MAKDLETLQKSEVLRKEVETEKMRLRGKEKVDEEVLEVIYVEKVKREMTKKNRPNESVQTLQILAMIKIVILISKVTVDVSFLSK